MQLLRYTFTGWSVFFAVVSVTIFVAFAVPGAFGLQTFNQWGGMYVDRWCHVAIASRDPKAASTAPLFSLEENAGEKVMAVYTAPMHSESTCLMWAKSRCGQKTEAGWIIGWIKPSMNGEFFAGEGNVCDLPLHSSDWFPDAL